MANKKNTRASKNNRSTKRTNKKSTNNNRKVSQKEDLKRETIKNEIIGIVIVFIGLFLLYSAFAKNSGIVGNNFNAIFTFLVGNIGIIVFGITLMLCGIYIVYKLRPFKDNKFIIFVFLILCNFLAMLNINGEYLDYTIGDVNLYSYIIEKGSSGGIIGILLGNLYTKFLSPVGAWVFSIVIMGVLLVLLFRNQIVEYSKLQREVDERNREEKEKLRQDMIEKKAELKKEKMRKQAQAKMRQMEERQERQKDLEKMKKSRSSILENPYEKEEIRTKKDVDNIKENLEKSYEEYVKEEERKPIINTYTSRIEDGKEEDRSLYKINVPKVEIEEIDEDEIRDNVRKNVGYDREIRATENALKQTIDETNKTKELLESSMIEKDESDAESDRGESLDKEKSDVVSHLVNEDNTLDDIKRAKNALASAQGTEAVQTDDIDEIREDMNKKLSNDIGGKDGKLDQSAINDMLGLSIWKNENENKESIKKEEKKEEKKVYIFPKTSLLKAPKIVHNSREEEKATDNARKLEKTLKDFKVGACVREVNIGPTVTRYELQLDPGIKVSKITNLSDDLAMSLAAKSVRIEAPIPGKSAVGIEMPNSEVSVVHFREIVESREFKNHKSKLAVALGKDVTGNMLIMDIAKLPHLLIAGATGSGKSVCVNTIINSVIFNATPEEVKLLLIDPKVVELSIYNGIPHLMVPVVTDPNHAANTLNWAVKQMDTRYDLFAQNIVRDIKGYNAKMEETGGEKMPRIIIIIDELADLMMTSANQVEAAICRLAQKARAAGIHLVLATQRPSVDVITGLIKANIPSRISFAVSSQIDSRTIMDSTGAEKLLGRGDMLYSPVGTNYPTRAQCSFISDEEVEEVVEFIKENYKSDYDEEVYTEITTVAAEEVGNTGVGSISDDNTDSKLNDAIKIAFDLGEISTSMLQRKLRVGYARAASIVDEMEERGIISAPDGNKPRKVLMRAEDFFGDNTPEEEEEF